MSTVCVLWITPTILIPYSQFKKIKILRHSTDNYYFINVYFNDEDGDAVTYTYNNKFDSISDAKAFFHDTIWKWYE